MDMPAFPDIVLWAIPFFIACMLLEMLVGKYAYSARYETRDTAASLTMGLGNVLIGFLTAVVTTGLTVWLYRYRIWTIPFAWWSVAVLLIAEDFCYYWFHRWSHEVRWMWAAHVNHHSSQHYNLSTALRQTWSGFFAGGWVLWLPLAVLGFHPAMIAFQKGISLVYQFWIHTESIKRLGPLEWIFNTPSHHRVHHAVNLKYLDKNHAGILIIWDRMFGTFEPEDANEPCRYGLIKYLATFNPWKIAFHEWVGIFKDVIRPKISLRERWMYMFGRPGWSHDGSSKTVPQMLAEQAPKPPA